MLRLICHVQSGEDDVRSEKFLDLVYGKSILVSDIKVSLPVIHRILQSGKFTADLAEVEKESAKKEKKFEVPSRFPLIPSSLIHLFLSFLERKSKRIKRTMLPPLHKNKIVASLLSLICAYAPRLLDHCLPPHLFLTRNLFRR